MNGYSISISNGKVIGDSTFFLLANELLDKEIDRICDFTDALDKDPAQKKRSIADYKCAKYRFAGVALVQSLIRNNNRLRKLRSLEHSQYLMPTFNEILLEHQEYIMLYNAAPSCEKPDYSLYYSVLAFTEKKIAELEGVFENAADWEKIELEERIGGLIFAKECLNEAWQGRG